MALHLVTSPAVEPLTVDDVLAHCRIDSHDESDWIERTIVVARRRVEAFTRRALITQTWSIKLDSFPAARGIDLPLAPLSSVSSVVYVDANGDSQTWATSNYEVDAPTGPFASPGRLVLADGISWPTTYSQINAVTIEFVAGYGATASTVPEELRHAALLMVGEMYERRELVTVGAATSPVAVTANALMWPFRVLGW